MIVEKARHGRFNSTIDSFHLAVILEVVCCSEELLDFTYSADVLNNIAVKIL